MSKKYIADELETQGIKAFEYAEFDNGSSVPGLHNLDKMHYHYSNGVLIKTNITDSDNHMFELYITGNSYSSNGPIDTLIQGYAYSNGADIIQLSGISKGYAFNVDVFMYNGFVYFWFANPSNYATLRFKLGTNGLYKKITQVSNLAKPTTGVTLNKTIVPHISYNSINSNRSDIDWTADVLSSTSLTVSETATASKIRLLSSSDASLTSTLHAFQIGSDSSFNIIMDNNEIMARNNSVASSLNFNPDGGAVTFNNNAAASAVTVANGNLSAAGLGDFGSYVSASEFRPTNIVTNKIVKFDGSSLNDSSISDDGTAVTVGSNLDVTGNVILGNGTVQRSLKVFHSDGANTELYGYGLIFDRSSSYLRSNNNGSDTLYIGGAAQDTNDWNAVRVFADNGLFYNNNLVATEDWSRSNFTRKYNWSVSGINKDTFINIAKVTGSSLNSKIRLNVNGTSSGNVFASSFEIIVNHSLDITVKSLSGNYSQLVLKIDSDSNDDFNISVRKDGGNTTVATCQFVIVTENDEVVTTYTNNPIVEFGGTAHEHTTKAGGVNLTSTGGTAANFHVYDYEVYHSGNLTKSVIDTLNVNADTLDNINSTQFLRSDTNDSFSGKLSASDSNRSSGIYGTYSSTKADHIWSMGNGFAIAADGTSLGTLYGMAYAHSNSGLIPTGAGTGHSTLFVNNGIANASIDWSSGIIWTRNYKSSVEWEQAYDWGDWSTGVTKGFVDTLNIDADTLDSYHYNELPLLSVFDGSKRTGVIPTPSRVTNPNPNEYERALSAEFKASSSTNFGSGSWMGLLTFASYIGTNVSGAGKQLQIGYDAGSVADVVKIRTGYDTTWESWKTLYHSGNLTNVSQLNNDAGYITESQDNQILSFNTSNGELNISGGNTIDTLDDRYMHFVTSTGSDWNATTYKNGIYRMTGSLNNPFGAGHATLLNTAQIDNKYGFQLVSNNGTGLKYRGFGTTQDTTWYDVYHSGNFISGTDYLTPTGNGSQLTNVYADTINVRQNDTFTGTYELVWQLGGNTLYSSNWLNVNGSTDTLHSINFEASGKYIASGSSGSFNGLSIENSSNGWSWINLKAGGTGLSGTNTVHLAWKNTAEGLIPANSFHIRPAGTVTSFYVNSSKSVSTNFFHVEDDAEIDGTLKFGANPTWGKTLVIGGNANHSTANQGSIGVTDGNLHLDSATAKALYLNFYDGTSGVNFGSGAGSIVAHMSSTGDLYKGGNSSGLKYFHEGNLTKSVIDALNVDADTLDGVDLLRIPYALNGVSGTTNTYKPDGGIGANAIRRSMFFRDNSDEFGAIGVHMSHGTNVDYALQLATSSYSSLGNLKYRLLTNGTWSSVATILDSANHVAGTHYNSIIGTDTDIITSGASVIERINLEDGVVQSFVYRNLTASDIGASPTSHSHSNYLLNSGIETFSGNLKFNATAVSGNYATTAIELREVNNVTTSQTGHDYAPALSFHWGGRMQGKLWMNNIDGLNTLTYSSGGGSGSYPTTNMSIKTGTFVADENVIIKGATTSTDSLLKLYNTTNGSGAGIEFSDHNTQLQKGFLKFYHGDTIIGSTNYGVHWKFTTDQANLAIHIPSNGGYYVGEDKVFHEGSLTNVSQLSNDAGYLTVESDTLQTVTNRDNTTSNPIFINNTLDVNRVKADEIDLVLKKEGAFTNNLGSPSVEEMSIIHGQMSNKFRFKKANLQEESTDGINWVTSTRATDAQLGDLMRGEGEGTSFAAIPTPTIGGSGYYRLTWDATSYLWLNKLYIYCSTSGNNVTFTLEGFHNTNGWEQIAEDTLMNWPGHIYLSKRVYFHPTNTSMYSKVRLNFSILSAAYTNQLSLYQMEWFGGYPAGRRNVESYDRDKNVTFPAAVKASGGDSTNWNDAYSWGDHAGLYASASHNHDSVYVNVGGDTMTGDLFLSHDGGSYSNALIFNGSSNNLGGEVGLRANGEGFQIYEPEDTSRVWLTIDDSSEGSNTGTKILTNEGLVPVFSDAYHPNSDKWTTARTLTLSGDLSGSVSIDGSSNVTLSAQVADDSHNHTHSDGGFTVNGSLVVLGNVDVKGTTGTWIESDVMTDAIGWNPNYGVYIGSNTSGSNEFLRGNGTFSTGGGIYNLFHEGNLTNVSQLNNDAGYLTIETDSQTLSWNGSNGLLSISNGNSVDLDGRYLYANLANSSAISFTRVSWDFTASPRTQSVANSLRVFDVYNDNLSPSAAVYGTVLNIYGRSGHQENNLFFGTDGSMHIQDAFYNETSYSSWFELFSDRYHPNADKWTTARTLTLGGDLSGSVSIDGSSNFTLTATVANDSHSHSNYLLNSTDVFTGDLDLNGNLDVSGNLIIGGKFTHNDGINLERWGRTYIVNSTTTLPLLNNDATALSTGGGYRITAHIPGTGTEQVAVAVFWNENGTWYCNNTFIGGTTSNHIDLLISSGVPSIRTWHASNYTIHVSHERLSLGEDAGNDNLRGYFGADSYLSWLESTNTLTVNGLITASGSTSANWNTAYNWGDHAAAGYLTSYTETNLFLAAYGGITTHPGTGKLIHTGQVSNGTTGLFSAVNNANSIITLNKHTGNYNSQLGFSSNGSIYYRNFNNETNYTTKAWEEIAFKGWSDSQFVSKIQSDTGTFLNGTYLQFGGASASNLDYIAYNESTNSYHFHADTTRQNTGASADIYIRSLYSTNNLLIESSDQATTRLQLSNTGTNGRQFDLISGIHNYSQAGFSIYDSTAAATRFVIDATGNIGVNTQAPSEKLHVSGNVKASRFISTEVFGSSTQLNLFPGGYGATSIMMDSSANSISINADSVSLGNSITAVTEYSRLKTEVPTSDNNFTGDIVYFGSSSGINSGDIVTFNSSGIWVKADASLESTSYGMMGIALGSSPSSGILIKGYARISSFSTLSTATPIFLSETAGTVTNTSPTATNTIVRVLGYKISTNTIYFKPDNSWIKNL